MKINLSIIIPAYNDQEGLRFLLPQLAKVLRTLGASYEILVVDDGSQTPLQIQGRFNGRLRILRHRSNKGYGAAIKTGLRNARGEFILIMDADGQHDPADAPLFYERIKDCDMVVGIRMNRDSSPLWRRPGKFFLKALLNSMSRQKIRDINCGFRCAKRDVIRRYMHLCSDGFSFSVSSTMMLLNRGCEVQFMEIRTHARIGHSTVGIGTGFETLMLIIRMVVLTSPLRFFLPVSAVLFLLGVVWAIPYALEGRGISVGALFLMMAGVLGFFFGVLSDQVSELLKERYE